MAPIVMAMLLSQTAVAGPVRGIPHKPERITPAAGRDPHRLVVKLAEEQGLSMTASGVLGPRALPTLNALLRQSTPLFSRHTETRNAARNPHLADLSLYRVIEAPNAVEIGNQLLARGEVETAYLASLPVPPPFDIPPTTSDYSFDQGYDLAGPHGFGFDDAATWPGGDGRNIRVANLEYGFDPTHEDLVDVDIDAIGPSFDLYQFHGNGVMGIMAAPDNGYGVSGLIPAAGFLVVSPFVDVDVYNVADAIDIAASMLTAGDILLIEQQGWVNDTYTPVEVDPAVFDAIASAVDSGIVVIEPAGNGACDLDAAEWDGAFNPQTRDSGAIMVGGGASPYSGFAPRSYHPLGSCFGERVDVQGWFDSIISLSAGDGAPSYTDLFFPQRDGRQAYTARFGGTSGAAPLVAAIAAVMNSVAIETRGEPWNPIELRAVLRSTGHPQADPSSNPIGPQPDLRRLLHIYGVR